MKKQIIFIGGGIAKENYLSFADYVEKIEYNPYEQERKKWTDFFAEKLGSDYEFIKIPMPNKYFADYGAWKIMFSKIFPFLKENFCLVGHSLGGTFLIKYLNENSFSYLPKNIFLLAPALNDSEEEINGSFEIKSNFKNFEEKYSSKTYFLHSKDDFVVSFSDFLEFKNIFPKSNFIEFENKNHFLDLEFVEFEDLIKQKF
ncbi:hypothetical protein D8B46_00025 [Candidatus Gracilibacteria bacterium]|nr:MAG: hypothetical protein D8B46_00025 [Candidatus Gracilibacteria bacterium]